MSDFFLGFVFASALAIASVVAGALFGYSGGTDAAKARAELRAACVKGNDRACRLYEVDFGR